MRSILTGKAKKDFDKWMFEDTQFEAYSDIAEYFDLDKLPFSMQYGVYVDFFDSVDIIIHSGRSLKAFSWYATYTLKHYQTRVASTRSKARIGAIKRANEIYNGTRSREY